MRPDCGLLICILFISMRKQAVNWCHMVNLPSLKFFYPFYPWLWLQCCLIPDIPPGTTDLFYCEQTKNFTDAKNNICIKIKYLPTHLQLQLWIERIFLSLCHHDHSSEHQSEKVCPTLTTLIISKKKIQGAKQNWAFWPRHWFESRCNFIKKKKKQKT